MCVRVYYASLYLGSYLIGGKPPQSYESYEHYSGGGGGARGLEKKKNINILTVETTGFKTSGRNRHERFDVVSFQRGDDRYR